MDVISLGGTRFLSVAFPRFGEGRATTDASKGSSCVCCVFLFDLLNRAGRGVLVQTVCSPDSFPFRGFDLILGQC